jgi:hypothetical protein
LPHAISAVDKHTRRQDCLKRRQNFCCPVSSARSILTNQHTASLRSATHCTPNQRFTKFVTDRFRCCRCRQF